MNREEKEYFQELSHDRAESAGVFEKPANRKMWSSIVEKYSEQAHFIYELIQNADDAGADFARFILYRDRLVFGHNGKRRFTVSNPATEEYDAEQGTLGDINAITGIAFSGKKAEENRIGKFGVGFKSVFQYTSTPHIYDPEIRFKINRFIIPEELSEDYPGRRPEETVFVFPFDHSEKTPEETYSDISDKLRSLRFPVLFLSSLMTVSYETQETFGVYEKNVAEAFVTGETAAEKINLLHSDGKNHTYTSMWMFSRFEDYLRYSVVFGTDSDGCVTRMEYPAFCYFPTREYTGLGFMIHAPFVLTDSREGIRAGNQHNEHMVELLSELAADSLVIMRDRGNETSVNILTDGILDVIPVDENRFSDISDKSCISFRPFYTKIKSAFAMNALLPGDTGFVSPENAYWAADTGIPEIFDSSCLAELSGNKNAQWVFGNLGAEEIQRTDSALFLYISSLTSSVVTEDDILSLSQAEPWNSSSSVKSIDAEFMNNRDEEWLFTLYSWLSLTSGRTRAAGYLPVFPDQDSEFCSIFDSEGREVMYLPVNSFAGCRTVRSDIYVNPAAAELLRKTGASKPSLREEIFSVIIPKYSDEEYTDEDGSDFRAFIAFYRICPQNQLDEFLEAVRKCRFLRCVTSDGRTCHRKVQDAYIPSEDLREYFETSPETAFADMEFYARIMDNELTQETARFLVGAGIKNGISVLERPLSSEEIQLRRDLPEVFSTSEVKYTDKYIDGFEELVKYTVSEKSSEKSFLIWNTLLEITENECRFGGLSNLLRGYCEYYSSSPCRVPFTSSIASMLISEPWIMNRNGYFVRASRTSVNHISDMYDTESSAAKEILKFLGLSGDEKKPEPQEPKKENDGEVLKKYIGTIKYTENSEPGNNRNFSICFGNGNDDKFERMITENIIPLMKGEDSVKTVVIAASPERADMITEKIMEKTMGMCSSWLVRFGKCSNEEITSCSVYKNRNFDIGTMEKCTVVTTPADFLSDCFMVRNRCVYLKKTDWDSIILDEMTITPEGAQELFVLLLSNGIGRS